MKKVFVRLADRNMHAQTFAACHPASLTYETSPAYSSPPVDPFHPNHTSRIHLPIALSHTLQLILLLDRIRVAASLGSIDELFSKALGNALDVSERGLTGT